MKLSKRILFLYFYTVFAYASTKRAFGIHSMLQLGTGNVVGLTV